MYMGFKLNIDDNFFKYKNDYYFELGKEKYQEDKKRFKECILEKYEKEDILDGDEIMKDWFPTIEADIFISHSHKDEKLAIKLAGWLYEEFGIRVFIDSCVWGNSYELLKKIDNNYCLLNEDRNTYDYNLRNTSTSHVYMMLSNSLLKMIDSVECVFFLNTENANKSVSDVLKSNKNEGIIMSPWIYSELQFINYVEKRDIGFYREDSLLKKKNIYEERDLKKGLPIYEAYNLAIGYRGDLSKLNTISIEDLDEIHKAYKKYENKVHMLDCLYIINERFEYSYE